MPGALQCGDLGCGSGWQLPRLPLAQLRQSSWNRISGEMLYHHQPCQARASASSPISHFPLRAPPRTGFSGTFFTVNSCQSNSSFLAVLRAVHPHLLFSTTFFFSKNCNTHHIK